MDATHTHTTKAPTHRRASHAARLSAPRTAPVLPSLPAELMACPTCQACTHAGVDAMAGAEHPGVTPATCPTCGITSIEYGLVLAIDAVLGDMGGLERLDDAL